MQRARYSVTDSIQVSGDLTQTSDLDGAPTPALKRAIGLPLLVLYGLGITIGAGIYVLIGSAAAEAGQYAPSAFLFAAVVMAFSALSFAELSGRIPFSAGEAIYVDVGFGQRWLTILTGLLIIVAATVAGAAISLGCAGYVAVLVPIPKPMIVAIIVILMGAIAMRGVKESVAFAGALTVVEILGLAAIVFAGLWTDPTMLARVPSAFPAISDTAALSGVISASLIAFFAFIGFDDVVNMVEETRDPRKVMPWAIIISLLSVTLIYFLVVFVAVQTLPIHVLAASEAPIGLLFSELTGLGIVGITLIAIFATINGVLIEIIMASRVIYGMANKGHLPQQLAQISANARIPANATLIVTLAMLGLALFVRLDELVELTSQMILAAFTLVNLALLRIKVRGDSAPEGVFIVPKSIPALGSITCILLLVAPLAT